MLVDLNSQYRDSCPMHISIAHLGELGAQLETNWFATSLQGGAGANHRLPLVKHRDVKGLM